MQLPGHQPEGAELQDDAALAELGRLLTPSRRLASWTDAELLELPRLYRLACTCLARLEREGEDSRRAAQLRGLLSRAHGLLMRNERARGQGLGARARELFLVASPRAIRAEWALLLASFVLFYGLALAAWLGVRGDLDRAYSLQPPELVDSEIEQLSALAEGEAFRGNFRFGLEASPGTAGQIVLHNLSVGLLFFGSALLPPVYAYMLGRNALMLGTYTAVAGHWGQAGAISSILWTHGVIEIQMLILVATAGLVLVRAWVRPGAFTRGHAMLREGRRALELLAPVFPLLLLAGLIEGFVSPHAPRGVRLVVAVASGLGLMLWVARGGRERQAPPPRPDSRTAPLASQRSARPRRRA